MGGAADAVGAVKMSGDGYWADDAANGGEATDVERDDKSDMNGSEFGKQRIDRTWVAGYSGVFVEECRLCICTTMTTL